MPFATADGVALKNGADEPLHTTYLGASHEKRRADILTVPGSGAIRGVWYFNDETYAVRDNSGATAGVLHKSTAAGWVEQALGFQIDFTSGTAEYLEGETLTQSGVTATINRVILSSGAWDGSAVGYLSVSTISGGTYAAGVATSSSGSATLSGAETANALPVGGRYEFINHNFFGHTESLSIYGCNGVSRAFEITQAGNFTFVTTGMTTDTPDHITAHRNHLFLAFDGGSVQHSSPGTPLIWNVITGAAELAIGSEITGFQNLQGSVLGIFSRNSIKILYGTSIDDWDLRDYREDIGAIEWTIGQPNKVIFMDDRGLSMMLPTQAYGDFASDVFSQRIQELLNQNRNIVAASSISRTKQQYRIFFTDKSAVYVTLLPEIAAFMPVKFDHVVEVICNGEDSAGKERSFFGSDDGFVYELDAGNNFDGTAMEYFIRLSFGHQGDPDREKQYYRADIGMKGNGQITLQYTPDFSFSDPDVPTHRTEDISENSGGGYYDIDNWDSFVWSSQAFPRPVLYIDGAGYNIGALIAGNQPYENPHTLYGMTLQFAYRRRLN